MIAINGRPDSFSFLIDNESVGSESEEFEIDGNKWIEVCILSLSQSMRAFISLLIHWDQMQTIESEEHFRTMSHIFETTIFNDIIRTVEGIDVM